MNLGNAAFPLQKSSRREALLPQLQKQYLAGSVVLVAKVRSCDRGEQRGDRAEAAQNGSARAAARNGLDQVELVQMDGNGAAVQTRDFLEGHACHVPGGDDGRHEGGGEGGHGVHHGPGPGPGRIFLARHGHVCGASCDGERHVCARQGEGHPCAQGHISSNASVCSLAEKEPWRHLEGALKKERVLRAEGLLRGRLPSAFRA
mmetsp:Transcript_7755/g.11705  ORF Transcript_7755/g.11705 Transcript_7755/m.11705 type:complete len:203 (-) Transcript_7755:670-1278(-)